MAAEIMGMNAGVVTLRISGKLTEADLAAAQKAAADLIGQEGRIRILVLAEKFTGWERGGEWNDLSFQVEHDRNIERMAIVGDEKWKDLALVFTAQGLRKFPIRYFPTAELAGARAWVTAN